MPVVFNTMEEFIEMLQDPGKRKVLAAEMARNSDAPDFSHITPEDKAQVMGSQQAQTPGPIPDIDSTQATTAGVALGQANSQASENNAQGFGGPAGGMNIGGMIGGLGQAAKSGETAQPAQAPTPRPSFVGHNIQANPVEIPGTVGGTQIDALARLLARR